MGAAAAVRLAVAGLLALAAWPALAAGPAAIGVPRSLGCLIEPDRVADIGSQVIGVVEHLSVERGDPVTSGQSLLTLRADVERASADAADARARIDADVKAAQASLVLAQQKLQRAQMLVAQEFVSQQAVEQARADQELALQKVAQSRSQQRVWGEERRVAEAQLALRTVRSPFSGVVVERFVNVGERVEEKPLLRVASIDPLRVELMVPTSQYGSLGVGDSVTIHPELPGAAPVNAVVRHVDQVLDAASNSFRVRLSLPNPKNRLPAGLRCKADLPLPVAAAPAPEGRVAPASFTPAAPVRPAPRTPL